MPHRTVSACALVLSLGSVFDVRAQDNPVQEPDIQPQYVHPLFAVNEKGHNDSSPSWAAGGLLAFERSEESRREIVIARTDGSIMKNVYHQTDEDDLGLGALLSSLGKSVSYNSGISWASTSDQFVFMSNAGEGNYDLYLGTMSDKALQRLTKDPQKDGQPSWSPTSGTVVFVSGRSGGAQLFLMDVASRKTTRISKGEKSYLYPRWSPDGRQIAAIYGANENHDIVVLDGVQAMPAAASAVASVPATISAAANNVVERLLTTWQHDDLSPSWSPDGKRLAFYSNYNLEGDPKIWSLVVIAADGSTPTQGEQLIAQVVAYNVIPDISSGPAWFPDSKRIAYVRNDKQDYSPIYVIDVDTRKSARLETGTSINHDLAVSSDGILAFRAQVDQWDQIFLVKLSGTGE